MVSVDPPRQSVSSYPSVAPHNPAQQPPRLELNCLVFGGERSQIFTVEIANTKNVSALRDAIKEKKQHAFRNVDADDLVLWHHSVAIDDNLATYLAELKLTELNPLYPEESLSETFPEPLAKGHLHVIIRRRQGEH